MVIADLERRAGIRWCVLRGTVIPHLPAPWRDRRDRRRRGACVRYFEPAHHEWTTIHARMHDHIDGTPLVAQPHRGMPHRTAFAAQARRVGHLLRAHPVPTLAQYLAFDAEQKGIGGKCRRGAPQPFAGAEVHFRPYAAIGRPPASKQPTVHEYLVVDEQAGGVPQVRHVGFRHCVDRHCTVELLVRHRSPCAFLLPSPTYVLSSLMGDRGRSPRSTRTTSSAARDRISSEAASEYHAACGVTQARDRCNSG